MIESKTRQYYDAAGRNKQTTNFGTFATGGLAGPMNGSKDTVASYDAANPESRSDTRLITTSTFDAAGRLQGAFDADNKETRYEYDDLGRRTAMVEDYGGLARRTEYQYNGNGDITMLVAKNVGGTDQQTEYSYGSVSTSGRVSSRWVLEIHYPNPSTGVASTATADKVIFTYNIDGTVATRTDQNQSVITYEYDALRRKIHERVTTVGSGVDSAVRRLSTTYTDAGQVEKVSSYDNATVGSGSVVNEVKFSYNGLGQLIKDEQDHDGAVDGSTLKMQYAYSESTASNHSRQTHMIYPNGRYVYAGYSNGGAAGNYQDEISDAFGRVTQFVGKGDGTDVYVEYQYAGLAQFVGTKAKNDTGYKGNDTRLNLDAGTADQYAGLDLFGRVVSQKVTDAGAGTTTRTDILYQANRDGSPKYAEPQSGPVLGRSSLYTYVTCPP